MNSKRIAGDRDSRRGGSGSAGHYSPLTAHRSLTQAGLSLIELLIVMAIVGLMLGIAYPNVSSGLDGIRLKTSISRAGAFWAAARQRADRFQEVVQVTVDPAGQELRALAADSAWRDSYKLDSSIRIAGLKEPVHYLLYPGTPSPQFELFLEASSGGRSGLRVNVLTGVPEDVSQ